MEEEILKPIDRARWGEIQQLFKMDFPRGIPGYYILDGLRELSEFKVQVLCPYEDINKGIVAVNQKFSQYEVIIQCPSDDTAHLEEALRRTKVIDWAKTVTVPYAPAHIISAVTRACPPNVRLKDYGYTNGYVYYTHRAPFGDVELPANVKFSLMKLTDDIDHISRVWPHKYPGSDEYFRKLIREKRGFGLYEDNKLICWVFIFESGMLGHLYTEEKHRKKGYAETIVKLICNERIGKGKDVFLYCLVDNTNSNKLFQKLGFEKFGQLAWLETQKNDKDAKNKTATDQ